MEEGETTVEEKEERREEEEETTVEEVGREEEEEETTVLEEEGREVEEEERGESGVDEEKRVPTMMGRTHDIVLP